MKHNKKPSRGQAFGEGTQVRSLREMDGGAVGAVLSASKKRTGWVYAILLNWNVVTRAEDELEEGS